MAEGSKSKSNQLNVVVVRSSSVDSAIFDGIEDSQDEFEEIEEQSFEEINEDFNDHEEYSHQSKNYRARLIRYGSKRSSIVQFSPRVVYGRCPEAEQIGEKYGLTFKFVKNETKLIRNILEGHGFREVHPSSSEFNILWTGGGMKPFTLRSLLPYQRVNHFPRSYEMTRKDRLYKNVQKMQQEKGMKNFNFIPTTFLLPYEFEDFSAAFQREKGLWIIKPVASSQGKGIFLINHPDQVPLDENLVISRYVDNPLLIDGYKFDVRIYVAVTSYDPLVAYLYEEGLTRFATVKYDPNSRTIKNSFMHLTNYSVNKRSHRYVRCDDPDIEDFGNKWSMSAMLRLLKSEGKDTFTLMMAIEDVVIKTLLSVESQISAACRMFVPTRGNCFEVYGFDILIDDELKPWVLEVNLSPSLACDAPIDLKIKSHMICDLLNLCSFPSVDPSIYSTKQRFQQKSDSTHQNDQMKKRRPISAGYSLNSTSTVHPSNSICPPRPPRATTANRSTTTTNGKKETNDKSIRNEYFGLSTEEIRILRTIKEENRQRGGFVRIFPTSDTFEFFSNFFEQRTTSFNQMIHQRLYPHRWTQNSLIQSQQPSTSTSTIRKTTLPRSKHLSNAFQSSNHQEYFHKSNGSDLQSALQRFEIYQRRLFDVVQPSSQTNPSSQSELTKSTIKKDSQISIETIEEHSSQKSHQIDRNQEKILHRTTSAPATTMKSFHSIKQDDNSMKISSTNPSKHSVYLKSDLQQLFQRGFSLSCSQARIAFATYLQRIQLRLMLDSELREDVTSNQHMELVLRFLKRAGLNLSPPFRVEIPSRRLQIYDQKRILAKQLQDFLHLYQKETTNLSSTSTSTSTSTANGMGIIDQKIFDEYLQSASESDLEQMMTNYMKTNPQSSIHLGVQPKTSSTRTNNSIKRLPEDLSLENDVQQLNTRKSPDDNRPSSSTKQIISRISSTTESDLTTKIKSSPTHRTSSASRQRNSQQQKKQEDIYRLYGISRPLSAVVQHRKQYPLASSNQSTTTTATTTTTTTKLLQRDRPNSANAPFDAQGNKDFVDQLNELSSKQHRRQYSGVHQWNFFHQRSLTIDPSTSPSSSNPTSNVNPSNDSAELIRLSTRSSHPSATSMTKDEEILEKTRQMIEESEAKNEQLAEQAKVFQRTLQRNEIYSALNRFSHRPPIYPPTSKDQKSTSNRFHQIRPSANLSYLTEQQHRFKSSTTNSTDEEKN